MKFEVVYNADDTRIDEFPDNHPESQSKKYFYKFDEAAKEAIEYLELIISSAEASIAHIECVSKTHRK